MLTFNVVFSIIAALLVVIFFFWQDRARLLARVKKAEAVVKADAAVVEAEVRAKVKQDVTKALNDLRADEKLLETHAYQIVARVRNDLGKLL
jgi:hypothetical protein